MYKILKPYGSIKVFVFLYSFLILGRIVDIYSTQFGINKYFDGSMEAESNLFFRFLIQNMNFWIAGLINIIFTVVVVLFFTNFLYRAKLSRELKFSHKRPLPQSFPLNLLIFLISGFFAVAWWNWSPSFYWLKDSLNFSTEKLVQEGLVQVLSDQRSAWIVGNVVDSIGALVVLIVAIIVITKTVKRIQNPM